MRACDSRLMPEMQKQPVSVELSATTRVLAEKYAETRANTIEHSRNRQALTVPPNSRSGSRASADRRRRVH